MSTPSVVVLAGGTGGARLARGFAAAMPAENLTVITNTADDDVFFGMLVSPDTDSVLYHLAGCSNAVQGFGIEGDTFNALAMLDRLGEPAWFRVGDADLGVQISRAHLLSSGATLSESTAMLAARLGVRSAVIPMSDDTVRTRVLTDAGELRFQEWFVRERCGPAVRGLRYDGIDDALPAPPAADAILESDAIVIGPSNPLLSIDPIVHLLHGRLDDRRVIAVSPLIGGVALKGPTVRMMRELGEEPTALGVARHHAAVATDFVIDVMDAALTHPIEDLGLRVHVLDTVMRDVAGERRLAESLLRLAREPA